MKHFKRAFSSYDLILARCKEISGKTIVIWVPHTRTSFPFDLVCPLGLLELSSYILSVFQ